MSCKIKSFLPLLERYSDHATNPACEPIDKTIERIKNPRKGFFKILKNDVLVGGIAIKQVNSNTIFLGPIFIDPSFQNQKIAQAALMLLEEEFSEIEFFELATIS